MAHLRRRLSAAGPAGSVEAALAGLEAAKEQSSNMMAKVCHHPLLASHPTSAVGFV